MKKRVLLIGLDPAVVDYASLPTKLDEPTLRKGLDDDLQKLRALGYEADWLLIDRGATAVDVASKRLASEPFDAVMIGAGIRTVAPLMELFEKLLNVVHENAPRAKICFNTSPGDTAIAVQRWV